MSEERKMGHVQPFKNYLFTFIALLVLTVVTVLASKVQFKFDLWNNVIAVGIAGIKASLVTLFFMHGRYEGRLTWAFVYYPVLLLLLLLGAVFLDYGFRADKDRATPEVTIAQPAGHGGDHGDAHGDAGAEGEHGDAQGEPAGDDHGEPAGANHAATTSSADHGQAIEELAGQSTGEGQDDEAGQGETGGATSETPTQEPPQDEENGGHD